MPEVTLPVKRVEGDTVAERLTETVRERVLPARYLRHEDGEVVEEPADMFTRVAEHVAAVESEWDDDPDEWAERFESMLSGLAFLPNSPTLMNAGTTRDQLAACFVINPEDDLGDIFETVRQAAEIFKTGGGVGYSFSQLRPKGDVVRETGGTASGPVSFMTVFDGMCETVKQGGVRRGAQMGILRVDHPDIGRSVTAKREEGRLSNFNISVAVTDEFLAAVEAGDRYDLVDPQTGEQHVANEATARFYSADHADADGDAVEANFWRDHAGTIPGVEEYRGELDVEAGEPLSLPARFVWDVVVDGAWRNGEPGLFFLDEANRQHAFDVEEHPDHRIRATNPCGEQPLENHEACNLGHVNLSLLASEDAPRWESFRPDDDLDERVDAFLDAALETDRLDRLVRDGLRFLDDVIAASGFPVSEISETVKGRRKVGLGVMGFAELLVQLGVPYGSDASVEVADQLMARIDHVATMASHDLADERGTFEGWATSKYADPTEYPDWFRQHTGEDPADWEDGFPVRNHGVTSVAPTGTTSMIADTSAGCEPLYDVIYVEHVGSDVGETVVHFDDYFERVLAANDVDPESIRSVAEQQVVEGTFAGLESLPVPEELARHFQTAHEVTPERHVRIQAAFQQHVDGAVSKTINLPASADRDDVADAFRRAVDLGCKGLTVYRAGSRESQALEAGNDEEAGGEDEETNPGDSDGEKAESGDSDDASEEGPPVAADPIPVAEHCLE